MKSHRYEKIGRHRDGLAKAGQIFFFELPPVPPSHCVGSTEYSVRSRECSPRQIKLRKVGTRSLGAPIGLQRCSLLIMTPTRGSLLWVVVESYSVGLEACTTWNLAGEGTYIHTPYVQQPPVPAYCVCITVYSVLRNPYCGWAAPPQRY